MEGLIGSTVASVSNKLSGVDWPLAGFLVVATGFVVAPIFLSTANHPPMEWWEYWRNFC